MDARSEKETAAFWQLNELRKSWQIEVYTHPHSGDAVVELFPVDRIKRGRPDVTDMVARYVEPNLMRAIARAWAGEPADG